ncbi:MAG: ABC transporter permease subunit [Sedimentisphaerales bacterium]|nr:ABC transporter permease subunit [Sedimentisphaerales bacterium]
MTIDTPLNLLSLSWLAGPIFDKELRVASRRRRTYVLRAGYILLLLFFICITWFNVMSRFRAAGQTGQAAAMGQMGQQIILTMSWFQFITLQVLGTVLMSNSLCQERIRGSLSTLMSTPIRSAEIILGKLFGRLLQPFLLLAAGLSVLSILRAFGGMDWDYVLGSFCITVTATLLAASISLFFSMRTHRAYTAILLTAVVLAFFYGIPVFIPFLISGKAGSTMLQLGLTSPVGAMMEISYNVFSANAAPGFSWPRHCLWMCALSIVPITLSASGLRHVALSSNRMPYKRPFWKRILPGARPAQDTLVKPVHGSPVLWREMRHVSGKGIIIGTILLGLASVVPLAVFLLYGNPGWMVFYRIHSLIAMALWLIVSLRTCSMAAVSITQERESRTWTSLLATPLSETDILFGKALAIVYRNIFLWIVLLVTNLLFYWCVLFIQQKQSSNMEPDQAIQYIVYFFLSLGSSIAFLLYLIGVGLFFSSRLRSTTAAVAVTVLFILVFYFLSRLLIPILYTFFSGFFPYTSIWFMLIPSVLYIAGHAGLGLLLLFLTKRRLRKNID